MGLILPPSAEGGLSTLNALPLASLYLQRLAASIHAETAETTGQSEVDGQKVDTIWAIRILPHVARLMM